LVAAAWLFAAVSITPAAEGDEVYDGYAAFYATLPRPLFAALDRRPLTRLVTAGGNYNLQWQGSLGDPARPLRVDIEGADIAINGRMLPAARSRAFPGETPTALGDRARLYAAADGEFCVEGVAPSSSGTAGRHVHVTLMLLSAKSMRYERYELPSLFASCLGIWRDESRAVHFFDVRYLWPEGQPQAEGVRFVDHVIADGRMNPAGTVLQARFIEPDNVYRFSVQR
jgi:hypothetical protein